MVELKESTEKSEGRELCIRWKNEVIIGSGVVVGSIEAFRGLKVGQFVGRKFVGVVVGIFRVGIFRVFVGRGVFGLAVSIEVRGSSGGW